MSKQPKITDIKGQLVGFQSVRPRDIKRLKVNKVWRLEVDIVEADIESVKKATELVASEKTFCLYFGELNEQGNKEERKISQHKTKGFSL